MYKLILILTFVANGASVEVEDVTFESRSACEDAKAVILKDFERDPVGQNWDDARILSRLHIDAYCVKTGRIVK